MATPLTQAALQRLAAMLMSPGRAGTNMGAAMVAPKPTLEGAVPPPPPAAPPVVVPPPRGPAGMVGENALNQNPPVPNPPLPPPVPPVTNASFGPMGSTPPIAPAAPPPATPDIANMPAPVGSDPSMADPGIRQTILNAMKAKGMLPPQWAQNFGSLADQQGG